MPGIDNVRRKIPRVSLDEDLIPVAGAFAVSSRMQDRRALLYPFMENNRESLISSSLDAAYSIGIGLLNIGYMVGTYFFIEKLTN